MKEWKIAIVGAGYMAQEHAKAFASLPGVRIVGICGRTASRAESLAQAHGAATFDSIDALYRETRADVVVVAVNELSMAEVAKACFAHPWVCFLEKPVGIDAHQAHEILAASQQARARCHVALNRRTYAATRQALTELESDPSPRLVSILDQQDMAAARDSGQPDAVVRNYMYANSIHLIDYMHVFCRGTVKSVDNIKPWHPEYPGTVIAAVHFDSGDTALYQAVWNGPGPWSVTVSTAQSRLEMRPLEKLGIQRRGERRLTEVAPDSVDTDFKPGLRVQAERIMAGLGGSPIDLATLEEATQSMDLCALIYGQPIASKLH